MLLVLLIRLSILVEVMDRLGHCVLSVPHPSPPTNTHTQRRFSLESPGRATVLRSPTLSLQSMLEVRGSGFRV